MAFAISKSFGELNSSLITWRVIGFLLCLTNLLTVLILFSALDNKVPVMITKDGQSIELNMTWEDWKQETRKPEAKGFARNMFQLLLKQDYRSYESNIELAQEQMTSTLRKSILESLKQKNVFQQLKSDQTVSSVEVPEQTIETIKQSDGFDVSLQAIVQTYSSRDIPKRERLSIGAHLKNTTRSTLHPNGFLLDSFNVKQRLAEPYQDPAAAAANAQQEIQ
jgi:hypothetical protein